RLDELWTPFRGLIQADFGNCTLDRRVCTTVAGEVYLPESVFRWGTPPLTDPYPTYRRAFAHELLHTIGIGHACKRQSVMMVTGTGCVAPLGLAPPVRPTEDDVALVEMLIELARVLVDHPLAWPLPEAAAGR